MIEYLHEQQYKIAWVLLMNVDAKLKWFVKIKTEIEMMNYELDEEFFVYLQM